MGQRTREEPGKNQRPGRAPEACPYGAHERNKLTRVRMRSPTVPANQQLKFTCGDLVAPSGSGRLSGELNHEKCLSFFSKKNKKPRKLLCKIIQADQQKQRLQALLFTLLLIWIHWLTMRIRVNDYDLNSDGRSFLIYKTFRFCCNIGSFPWFSLTDEAKGENCFDENCWWIESRSVECFHWPCHLEFEYSLCVSVKIQLNCSIGAHSNWIIK